MAHTIVFVQRGGLQPYVQTSLAQARRSNPGADIVLIGDGGAEGLENARYVDLKDVWADAGPFADAYQHLSTNRYEFELFCFQRWFALVEFMEREGIAQCVHLDTDVLLFADVEALCAPFAGFPMTVHGATPSPHVLIVNEVAALRTFCDYVRESYAPGTKLERLKGHYKRLQDAGQGGGVCDMTAFHYFREDALIPLGDTSVETPAGFVDNNVATPEGFALENGLKRLVFGDGAPRGIAADGRQVQMLALHFQGDSKAYMEAATQGKMPSGLEIRLLAAKRKAGKGWARLRRMATRG